MSSGSRLEHRRIVTMFKYQWLGQCPDRPLVTVNERIGMNQHSNSVSVGDLADKVGIVTRPVSMGDIAQKIGYDKKPISLGDLAKAVDKYLVKSEKK
jgi:hypothetical protein